MSWAPTQSSAGWPAGAVNAGLPILAAPVSDSSTLCGCSRASGGRWVGGRACPPAVAACLLSLPATPHHTNRHPSSIVCPHSLTRSPHPLPPTLRSKCSTRQWCRSARGAAEQWQRMPVDQQAAAAGIVAASRRQQQVGAHSRCACWVSRADSGFACAAWRHPTCSQASPLATSIATFHPRLCPVGGAARQRGSLSGYSQKTAEWAGCGQRSEAAGRPRIHCGVGMAIDAHTQQQQPLQQSPHN